MTILIINMILKGQEINPDNAYKVDDPTKFEYITCNKLTIKLD